jgi:hypothetical protein
MMLATLSLLGQHVMNVLICCDILFHQNLTFFFCEKKSNVRYG